MGDEDHGDQGNQHEQGRGQEYGSIAPALAPEPRAQIPDGDADAGAYGLRQSAADAEDSDAAAQLFPGQAVAGDGQVQRAHEGELQAVKDPGQDEEGHAARRGIGQVGDDPRDIGGDHELLPVQQGDDRPGDGPGGEGHAEIEAGDGPHKHRPRSQEARIGGDQGVGRMLGEAEQQICKERTGEAPVPDAAFFGFRHARASLRLKATPHNSGAQIAQSEFSSDWLKIAGNTSCIGQDFRAI